MRSFIIIFLMAAAAMSAQDISITIYNENYGVIKETRKMEIPKGRSEIMLADVPSEIIPASVFIELNGSVLEQNYRYDLASLFTILQRYIDKEVTLVRGGQPVTGKLLSVGDNNIVLQKEDGSLDMFTDTDDTRVLAGALPEGLITKPALQWLVESKSGGKQDVELSYHTKGMSWQAEYILVLNEDDTRAGLNAWVSIDNQSGASFKKAKLQLIAGDVNIIRTLPSTFSSNVNLKRESFDESAFREDKFFEYHKYELQRETGLQQNETKQIGLFNVDDIEIIKKYYYIVSENNTEVTLWLQFTNSSGNNMGMPLPKGKIRVNKASNKDELIFLGEDLIEHTPKDEQVKINIGNAFDIIGETTLLERNKIANEVTEEKYKVELRNRKEEEALVEVWQNFWQRDWEIVESEVKFKIENARKVKFLVPALKAGEVKSFTYKVRIKG
ncbi:MAG: DUF4139 domain-containing protein [Candidatus Kapaibacterium sp.]